MSKNKTPIDPEKFAEMIMKWNPADDIELTESQTKALGSLEVLSDMKFSGKTEVAGIATRPIPLLVGASGSGKTALVREFARRCRLPLFSVNVNSWIPIGAKFDDYTLTAIRKFVQTNGVGIIFIDEINKLRTSHTESGWFMSILNEVIALLDGDDRLRQAGFDAQQIAHLKNFLIIGAGAWQEEWVGCRSQATLGFAGREEGETTDAAAFLEAIKRNDVIPQELLYRFNERLILLEAPTEGELAARIIAIRAELTHDAQCDLDSDAVRSLVRDAIRSGCPMRWLEAFAGASIAASPIDEMQKEAEEQREQLRNKAAAVSYGRLYNSGVSIVKKLGYDTSLAALDLKNCLQSERVREVAPLSRYLAEFARAGRIFSLPTISDIARRNFFQKLETHSAGALKQCESLLKHDAVECLRETTYAALRKFVLLADQLKSECDVVAMVMADPGSLAKDKIKDHDDDRVDWF